MRTLRITEAHDYDLIGTLLASTETAAAPAPRRRLIQHRAGLRDSESDSRAVMHYEVSDLPKAGESDGSRRAVLQSSAAARSIWATGRRRSTSSRLPPTSPARLSASRDDRLRLTQNKPAWLFATWFGCGYSPFAPGTVGSLAAIVIAWPLSRAGFGSLHFLILALVASLPGNPCRRHRRDRNPAAKIRRSSSSTKFSGQWLTLAGRAALRSSDVRPRLRAFPAVRYLEAPAHPSASSRFPAARASCSTT